MDLIFKIASVGIVVAIVCQILSKSGRDDLSMLASLAGLTIVILMVADQLKELFDTVKSMFTF